MLFKEFIGTKVNHGRYGEGRLSEFILNKEKTLNSSFKVTFNTDEKLFPLNSFIKYFEDVPEALIKKIIKLSNKQNEIKCSHSIRINKITGKNINYLGEGLGIEDWEDSLNNIASYFWHTNEACTPVVKNNSVLYIDARAACFDLGENINNAYDIYYVCNENGINNKFKNCRWRFATSFDIESWLEKLKINE